MAPHDRSNVISLRLSDDEMRALEKAAKAGGVTNSDVLRGFLRSALMAPKSRRSPKASGAASRSSGVEYRALAAETLVHDMGSGQAIMHLDGIVALPVGAEIELVNPNVNARVMRVRLLANEPATVCLDVVIPNE